MNHFLTLETLDLSHNQISGKLYLNINDSTIESYSRNTDGHLIIFLELNILSEHLKFCLSLRKLNVDGNPMTEEQGSR